MVLVVACVPSGRQVTTTASSSESTTIPPTTFAPVTTLPTTTTLDTGDLAEWELATVVVAGEELEVAVADEPAERAQGLMGVEDLGDLAGMLFVFDADTQSSFWMKDTIIRLDIAFFASDGSLVDLLVMEPCATDPCPLYHAAATYRWALETPVGDLDGLEAGATLVIP